MTWATEDVEEGTRMSPGPAKLLGAAEARLARTRNLFTRMANFVKWRSDPFGSLQAFDVCLVRLRFLPLTFATLSVVKSVPIS